MFLQQKTQEPLEIEGWWAVAYECKKVQELKFKELYSEDNG